MHILYLYDWKNLICLTFLSTCLVISISIHDFGISWSIYSLYSHIVKLNFHLFLQLFEKLQKYLGIKYELEGGYSWSLIHRVDTDSDKNSQLSAQRIENNSKLAVGLAIMDECFLPIIDRRSGVNLIRNVLYNCG